MKSTGVVRRIDELGRIVIPKEIRKNFRIKEGENLEIFINDNETIIIEINYIENNVNVIAEQDSDNEELISILNNALTDEAISKLQMMKPGQYKYLNDLRILKN